jgi:hypothetical protein
MGPVQSTNSADRVPHRPLYQGSHTMMKFQDENFIVLPDLHLLAALLISSTPSSLSQDGMNISMLLNIDDLGANIASTLRANPDIGNVSLDPSSPSNS